MSAVLQRGLTARRVCGLLVAAACTIGASADLRAEYLIKNWTTADGLPDNSVRAIVESRDGYLWMGTANGLARFDGVRFKNFDAANTPDLPMANIFALAVDQHDGLWLSTRRGVFRHHAGKFTAMPRPEDGVSGAITNLEKDPQGEVWMRIGDKLCRWAGDRIEAQPMPLPAEAVQRFYAAAGSVFWLAASNGLWRQREGRRVERVNEEQVPGLLASARGDSLWGIVEERRLVRLEGAKWESVTELPERCNTLFIAANGDVWLGSSSNDRAHRWRNGQLLTIGPAQGLRGNRTIAITEDREGNIWLGMNGAGLFRLREKRLRVFDREHGFGNTALSSVIEDANGEVTVGCMGWNFYRRIGERFEPLAQESSTNELRYATALAPARAGGIWAGTFYGPLVRVSENRIVEWIGQPAGTRSLFVDRDGGLWRGTLSGGVECFSGTNVTGYAVSNGLSHNNVYALEQDRAGAMWVGTEQGLNRIADGRITQFGRTNGLGHHFVTTLCVDSQGTLWAGTLGGGLSGWNGGRFLTVTTREGLADDTVQQLIEDDFGYLWVGTRAGLMRVAVVALHDFLNGKSRVIHGTLIGRSEGLDQPNCWTEYQPASAKSRDGRLWVCTGSGLALIDPRQFDTPALPPITHIEEVELDGGAPTTVRELAHPLTVAPRTQRLQIRYTGLSPSDPELVRFRYRLNGYDRDWVEAGWERTAAYSRVPPGRYEFEVRAVNNRGTWSTTASLPVVFQPAFWQTWWFRGVAMGAVFGLVALVFRVQVALIEKRRAQKEALARQLIDQQEAERKRIAAELHDGLGQSLMVVKNRALMGLKDRANATQMAAQLDQISEAATHALTEAREISFNLRPHQLDALGLAKALAALADKAGQATGIAVEQVISADADQFPLEARVHLFRIAQECLNNAVKHAQAKRIRLELTMAAGQLRLVVQDDGRGFVVGSSSATHLGGLGSATLRERVQVLGGTMHVDSAPGRGTRVTVEIPLPRPTGSSQADGSK